MDAMIDLFTIPIGIFIWTSTQVSACQRGSNNDSTGKKQSEKNLQQNGFVEVNGNIPLAKYENNEKPWDREEVGLLIKGMLKYPKGTS
uniref:Uncharacterized protein n=1 Tax=Vitis vinifera TaxID=29760 RepID=F6H770_VITVI